MELSYSEQKARDDTLNEVVNAIKVLMKENLEMKQYMQSLGRRQDFLNRQNKARVPQAQAPVPQYEEPETQEEAETNEIEEPSYEEEQIQPIQKPIQSNRAQQMQQIKTQMPPPPIEESKKKGFFGLGRKKETKVLEKSPTEEEMANIWG